MKKLYSLLFFGLHSSVTDAAFRQRVNLARTKIYFRNTFDSLSSLILGGLLASAILWVFGVDVPTIAMWYAVILALGFWIFWFERRVVRLGLTMENHQKALLQRLGLTFAIGSVWGLFTFLLPHDSIVALFFGFIAMATLSVIGVLSYSVIPMQFITYSIPTSGMLFWVAVSRYIENQDKIYALFISTVSVLLLIMIRRAMNNARTAIDAIVLNEKLKDEIAKTNEAHEKIAYLSLHDQLTGLPNRRYFDQEVPKIIDQAVEAKHPFSLFKLNTHHFRSVNSQHGHDIGDELLVAIVEQIQKNSPEGGFLSRYGGDEFILVVPNLDAKVARMFSYTLKEKLQMVYLIGDLALASSVSVGWATNSVDGNDLKHMMMQADMRMALDN